MTRQLERLVISAAETRQGRLPGKERIQIRERNGFASLEALVTAGLIGRLDSRQTGERTFLGMPIFDEEIYRRFALLARPEHNTLVLGPSDAGKTTGLVESNAYMSKTPTIITSTRPETFFKIAPTLLAKGEKVSVFDPTGQLLEHHRDELESLGITPSTWSPFVDYDGSFDWVKRTADTMVKTSTIEEDRGDNKEYWKQWTKGWLEPVLMKAAEATDQDFREEGVRSRMEYFLELVSLTPDNAKSVRVFLKDKIDQLEGKKYALSEYGNAVIGADTVAERREILQAQLATITHTRDQAFTEARAGRDELVEAKRKVAELEEAKEEAELAEFEENEEVTAEISSKEDATERGEPTELTPGIEVTPAKPKPAKMDLLIKRENKRVRTLSKRLDTLESRRWRMEGALDLLEAMAGSDNPLTAAQALEAEVNAHLESKLTKSQLREIEIVIDQVSGPRRSDGKTSASDVYHKMSLQVIEPWRNVNSLRSTMVENDGPVFNPDTFFSDRHNKLFVYMPLDDAERFAPITNLFVTKATATAIANKYPWLPTLLLDEAVLAARIGDFSSRISALRGNVRLLTVAQTRALLEEKFGVKGRKNIEDNHQVVIDFTTEADMDDLDLVSRRIGYRSVDERTDSWNESSGRGKSTGKRNELIMRPDELNALPEHTAVVAVKGYNILVKFDSSADLGLEQVFSVYDRIPALLEELAEREANDYWNSTQIMADGIVSAVESIQAIERAQKELRTQPSIEESLRRFLEEQGIATRRDASVLLDGYVAFLRQAGRQAAARMKISESALIERCPDLFTEEELLRVPR